MDKLRDTLNDQAKKKAFQIQAFVDILIYSKSWKLSLDQIWNMIL